MNKTLAQKIQSSKYFQAIKHADEKIHKFLFADVSDETKKRVVENIEKANSAEYRHMVASHALVTMVLDDMLNDPYWHDVIVECLESRKG